MKDKLILLTVFLLLSFTFVSGAQEYGIDRDSNSQFEAQDWFEAPTYDSQNELIFEILAPFAFVTIVLQMSIKKALRMTFATEDDNPFTGENKPNVHKESTIMGLTISAILMTSPYWVLVRQMAASIGLLSIGMLGLLLLYMAYLFISG